MSLFSTTLGRFSRNSIISGRNRCLNSYFSSKSQVNSLRSRRCFGSSAFNTTIRTGNFLSNQIGIVKGFNQNQRSISRSLSTSSLSPSSASGFSSESQTNLSQELIFKRKSEELSSSSMAMDEKMKSQYTLPLDQPIVSLDCDVAFNSLTLKEKLYAHHLSRACWEGGFISSVQASPESPLIISIAHNLFKTNGIDGLKEIATKVGFTEDEWKAFLVYICGVLSFTGNYKGFGDTKIVPDVPAEKLDALIKNSKYSGWTLDEAESRWNSIKGKVFSLEERERQLGLGPDKGITTYFSDNCDMNDAELISRFMQKIKQEMYITRVFKTVDGSKVKYAIRHASVTSEGKPLKEEFEGCEIEFTYGDYSPMLKKVCTSLKSAIQYASNDTEVNMIKNYIKSFTEGSLDAHKEGSRYWIKDKGPSIETYIGFIETYRDPAGTRGEFEGFVSMVNRPMSEKFQTLVDNAPQLLELLPWPKEFEKETFLKPDFTSLDVLSFSGGGIPAGINIPNYDEIRQNEGFKNVSLGNVIPASYKDSKIAFLSEEDKEILNKYRIDAFEVQVGLHELLGHGSGKLFTKAGDGNLNFDSDTRNPIDNSIIEKMYNQGETYDSVFSSMGSTYEECRAEAVGIFLSLDDNVLKIFGHEGEEAQNIKYANWLSMVFAGAAKALEMYQPEKKAWMQAHMQARYVIMQVLLEAGQGLVNIEEKTGEDGKPDLLITVDRTKIDTVGKKAISDFLLKLQVYKSTADFTNASKMYEYYSAVNNEGKYPWAKWRDIILDKKQPRKIFVQHNTFINESGNAELKVYNATNEGFIQSWIDRYPDNSVYSDLDYCWNMDKPFF